MIAVLLALQLSTPTLALSPGDTWSGSLVQKMTIPREDNFVETFNYMQSYKAVKGNGNVDLQATRKLLNTVLDDQVVEGPKNDPLVWTTQVKPGKPTDLASGFPDFADLRWQRTLDFSLPISASDAWTIDFPEIPVNRAPQAQYSWKWGDGGLMLGRRVRRAHGEFSESGVDPAMKASADVKVDVLTGAVLEMRVRATNAPVPGGNGYPAILDMTWICETAQFKKS